MSSFTRATFRVLVGEFRHRNQLYAVQGEDGQGFWFWIGTPGRGGFWVHVPEGFVTDGPSIPWWLKRILPRRWIESMMLSSALHDWMRENLGFNKVDGDAVFLIAMNAEGTPWWLREIGFMLVRLNNSRDRAL